MTVAGKVAVVGGGLAGLTAAHALVTSAENDTADVVVCEGESCVGGKLRTVRRDGFVLEGGADGYLLAGGEVDTLAEELGVADRIVHARPTPVRAHLRTRRGLVPFLMRASPIGDPRSLLRSPMLSFSSRTRVRLEPLVPRRRFATGEDESVEGFLTRRLGRGAYRRVYEPLLFGIYGAPPADLGARATLPALFAAEADGRSLLELGGQAASGGPRIRSFRDGMGCLTQALHRSIGLERVRTDTTVSVVTRREGCWLVQTAGGASVQADAVILATPAHVTARLLEGIPSVVERLDEFTASQVAVVNLAYREHAIARALNSHGYLNALGRQGSVTACTWSSVKFDRRAPPNAELLRVFVRSERVAAEGGDDALVRIAREELSESLGISDTPLFSTVDRWKRTVYGVGHGARVDALRSELLTWPGLAIAGASFDGVGLESVVRSGRRAARDVLSMIGGEVE